MRYGMNLLLWTDVLSEEFLPLLVDLKKVGFDTVELPILELDTKKCAHWGMCLDEIKMGRSGVAVRGSEDNPMSADPSIRKKGIEANKLALECCQAAGCTTMVGPFHSAIGEFSGKGPTEDEWKRAVESMRIVSEHAEKCGVTIALEALNRFECYLLNTCADVVRFCKDVSHPRCKMMYDTFHAHIEENNIAEAIRTSKDYLCHVHISENDRSIPGTGTIRWMETFRTLNEIGYDGDLVIEAFGLALEKLVPATKIWRRMYNTELGLATEGLKFTKEQAEKYW